MKCLLISGMSACLSILEFSVIFLDFISHFFAFNLTLNLKTLDN